MSDNNLLLKIFSKYIIDFIISHLQSNIYFKIIKYNKKFHQEMNINLEQTLKNYLYNIRTKENLKTIDNDIKNQINQTESYKMYYKYLKLYQNNINNNLNDSEKSDIFLIKYKGYKINDFPLPSNFNKVKLEEKLLILENNVSSFKYTLNYKNIELIYLINEFRENNNLNKLTWNKIENLNDFFREKNSNNNRYLFTYHFGEFKNKLLTKDEKIIKILLIKELKYIMILQKEKSEFIFIYSDNDQQSFLNIAKNPLKFDKFFLVNNTVPIINTNMSINFFKIDMEMQLRRCFKDEGFQIFSFKKDTLIGVLEGPPKTSFENGYFLFKIIFFEYYPYSAPKFIFISNIFHPNISEDGFVSIDVLNDGWSPALGRFNKIIYSVQSLLDDPNPDDFLNEKAAKLFKEDRNIYNKIVREYTSNFASYQKFLEEMKRLNLDIITNKNGVNFISIYSKE